MREAGAPERDRRADADRAASARAWAAAAVRFLWTGLRGFVSLATWSAVANVVVSLLAGLVFCFVLVTGLVISCALSWIVGIGTMSLVATLRLAARMARFDRWRLERLGGVHIDPLPLPESPAPGRRRALARDWMQSAEAWRVVGYELIRLPVAALAAYLTIGWWQLIGEVDGWWPDVQPREVIRLIPIVIEVACVLSWPAIARAASSFEVFVARRLLTPSRSRRLSAEIERLGEARTDAVIAAESERRRIERDLHDGLQPRLVSLSIDLGLAKARLERDPEASRSLLNQAHDDVKMAIEDLRKLVRGIHPSVLDGRGLDAALSALIAGCPVPVEVRIDLPQRPGPITEATAYYLIAEAVTNVTKHAQAHEITVTVQGNGKSVHVVIEDDGRGGAHLEPGGGLVGLAARVRSIDGAFAITSPEGGPTRVEATIPCER